MIYILCAETLVGLRKLSWTFLALERLNGVVFVKGELLSSGKGVMMGSSIQTSKRIPLWNVRSLCHFHHELLMTHYQNICQSWYILKCGDFTLDTQNSEYLFFLLFLGPSPPPTKKKKTIRVSASHFAEVHPDEMPQFIDYIDDGSGWDKEFATA